MNRTPFKRIPYLLVLLTALGAVAGCSSSDPEAGSESGTVQRGCFATNHGYRELEYELIDGRAIFEGDIILPLEDDRFATAFGGLRPSGAGRDTATFRWAANVVPYSIDPALTGQ